MTFNPCVDQDSGCGHHQVSRRPVQLCATLCFLDRSLETPLFEMSRCCRLLAGSFGNSCPHLENGSANCCFACLQLLVAAGKVEGWPVTSYQKTLSEVVFRRGRYGQRGGNLGDLRNSCTMLLIIGFLLLPLQIQLGHRIDVQRLPQGSGAAVPCRDALMHASDLVESSGLRTSFGWMDGRMQHVCMYNYVCIGVCVCLRAR